MRLRNQVAGATDYRAAGRRRRSRRVRKAPRHNFIDELVLKKLAALRISAVAAVHRRRVHPPGVPRRCRHPADAGGSREVPRRHVADKRAKLIDALLERPEFVDYWAYKWSRPAARLDAQAAAAGDVGVLPVHPPERGRQQAVGPLRPRHPDRHGQHAAERRGQLLRPAQGRTDLTETTSRHVPRHVDHLRPLPQPPAGEVDAGPVLGDGEPVPRVGLKNGDRAGEVIVQSLARRRRAAPAPRHAMPPTPLDGKPLRLDSTPDRRAVLRRLADRADNPYFAKALVNRVWRELPGPRPGRGRGRPAQTNPPTNAELLDALAKDFVEHKLRREAPDPHDHELGRVSAVVAAGAGQRGRRPLLLALPRSAGCRPR